MVPRIAGDTYAAVAVNISTLRVPPPTNMRPPAKATVKIAIVPSNSPSPWILESTVMAAMGSAHAMTIDTPDVKCNIRRYEYVLRVDGGTEFFLHGHTGS